MLINRTYNESGVLQDEYICNQYDGKKAFLVYNKIPGLLDNGTNYTVGDPFTSQNPRELIFKIYNAGVLTSTTTSTYAYEYDSNNYPTKVTTTKVGSPVTSSNIAYNCR